MTKKKLINLTIQSIQDNSKDWFFSEYCLQNAKLGITLWIDKGNIFFWKPVELRLSIFYRSKLNKAIEILKIKQLEQIYEPHTRTPK